MCHTTKGQQPNTNLLDCIPDTVSSWIQAFHQALHISAILESVPEIRPTNGTKGQQLALISLKVSP